MNILIDYLASNIGGGKTVAQSQFKALLELDKKNFYYCLVTKGNNLIDKEYENCKIIYVNYHSILERFYFQLFRIPTLIYKNKINIYFTPNNYLLCFNKKVKKVIMFQDANLFHYGFVNENFKSKIKYRILRILANISYKYSSSIIFISSFVKGNREKGQIVYLGIKNNNCSKKPLNDKKYDIALIVSNFSKHKNIKKLIDSVEYYKIKYKKELKVIIIGGDININRIKSTKEYMKNKGLVDVNITGLIPHKEVSKYLIKSKLYISTSLLEAFPLTQFEALNCNIPIILSDIQVYKELCGNFNIYFNPNNRESIADKIHDVFENYEYYYNLIPEIKKYASKFTWENHAKKLIEIFESLKEK